MIVDENVKFRFMAAFSNYYILSVFLKAYLGIIPDCKTQLVRSGRDHRLTVVLQKDLDKYFEKAEDGDSFKIMIHDQYSLYITYHIDIYAHNQYKTLFRLYDVDDIID